MDGNKLPRKLTAIFLDEHNTLRSGVRFAIFVAVFVIVGATLGAIVLAAFSGMGEANSLGFMLLNAAVALSAALFAGWFCGKYLEGLPFEALGASFAGPWAKNLALGLGLGAASLSLAVLVAYLSGGVTFSFNAAADGRAIIFSMAASAAVLFVAAAFEEVLFRGYMMQTFFRSNLAVFGVLLTSVLFASVHNTNPNATVFSWANTFIAGIWFAVAYLKTRELWFVTGLHFMWNWMQGAFYGIEVSGLRELIPAPLMLESDSGPAWLTGGEYGLEGGIACTVALIISTAAIWLFPLKRSAATLPNTTTPVP
ncbi:hypothetical protein BH24ACI3_BH24ACI3_03020 [soil metagenome]